MSKKFAILYASAMGVTLYLSLLFSYGQAYSKIELPIDSESEAIRISARTPTFQKELKRAWNLIETHNLPNVNFALASKAYHWDTSIIKWHKDHHPNAEEIKNLPDDHGVWKVDWNAVYFDLLQFIDEQTGEIHYERVYYFG